MKLELELQCRTVSETAKKQGQFRFISRGLEAVADSGFVLLGGTHFVRLKRRTPWKIKIKLGRTGNKEKKKRTDDSKEKIE